MTRNNNVTMSSRSQNRSTRHQRRTSTIVSKISRGRTTQALEQIIHSLYVMRCGYGSQCKSIRAGVMQSKRFKPKIKRAAEFNTAGQETRANAQEHYYSNPTDYRPRHAPREVLIQQTKSYLIGGSTKFGNNSFGKHARHTET